MKKLDLQGCEQCGSVFLLADTLESRERGVEKQKKELEYICNCKSDWEIKSSSILLNVNTSINTVQHLKCHMQAVSDAIKMVHSDEKNVERQ